MCGEGILGFRMSTVCVAGFSDNGEMWRNEFETETFVEDMQELWKQVEPLYSELHTYVKRKLSTVYEGKLGDDDLIPAHILGS
jgi:peptidyl-dipeptidase A